MIKSITVTNHLGESLMMELGFPEKSGILIRQIDGLGPTRATINSTELTMGDGSFFTYARTEARNIVMSILYMFNPSVEDARQMSYKYFPPKKMVKFDIHTDNRQVYTYGIVESNEPNIFSETSGAQISIMCPDPYFYAEDGSAIAFAGAEPLFEFPFSNESYTEKLINFGEIRIDSRAIVSYEGDADTGMIMTLHAVGKVTNITLYNTDKNESMYIDTGKIETISGAPFDNSDDIIISTIKGNKYAMLLRNGVYTNILGALGKNSDWFQLEHGDNVFAYSAEEGEKQIMITFAYRNAYGGV